MIGFCSRGKQKNQQSDNMKTKCDYCGKIIRKRPRELEKYNHHFCNRECYLKFKRNNKHKIICKKVDTQSLRKIKYYAKVREYLLNKPKPF